MDLGLRGERSFPLAVSAHFKSDGRVGGGGWGAVGGYFKVPGQYFAVQKEVGC